MSREFSDLRALAVHVAARSVAMAVELQHGLKAAAEKIEQTAHDEVGAYQAAVGPFPAWAQLTEVTEERKSAMGYPAGAPLLASGDMRDSLSHEVHGLEAGVGFADPVAVFHELGTSRMPARPVLGPAAFRNKDAVEKLIGAAAVAGLIGRSEIAALGYAFDNTRESQTG